MKSKFILETFNEGYVTAKSSKGPDILFIEPTTRCNLNCKMCFRRSWSEKLGDMSEKIFNRVLDDAVECNVKFIWFAGWGEPLLNPKTCEFIEAAHERGFEIGVNTNGFLIDDDVLNNLIKFTKRITISIDAATPETYGDIRGSDFRRLIENIKAIHKAKKESSSIYPILEFAFTIMKSNYRELIPLLKLAEQVGVGRVIVSNVIPVSRELLDECLYTVDGFNVESLVDGATFKSLETNVGVRLPEFTLKTERKCMFIENNAACITWNGNVAPCYNFLHTYTCYIYGVEKHVEQVSFGNIAEKTLGEIWNNIDYIRFRYNVRFFRFPSCSDCKFHELCDFAVSNEMDCWGNTPTCADCLYGRGIVQCPI